jgi:hypothetical protein
MSCFDYDVIYDIGGPTIKLMIEELRAAYIVVDLNDTKYIEGCTEYLLSLDDVIFEDIYINLLENIKDGDKNKHASNLKFNYQDYVYSYISNIELIHRCYAISIVPLNSSINCLHCDEYKFINFDIESCKLLHNHNCDLRVMLRVAEYVNNRDVITYIIDNMTNMDYAHILMVYGRIDINMSIYTCFGSKNNAAARKPLNNPYFHYNLVELSLIDKIMHKNDRYLKTLLHNKILGNMQSLTHLHFIKRLFIAQCYYIIQYIPIEECKQISTKLNKDYTAARKGARLHIYDKIIQERVLMLNDVLEFHLRPRGFIQKVMSILHRLTSKYIFTFDFKYVNY